MFPIKIKNIINVRGKAQSRARNTCESQIIKAIRSREGIEVGLKRGFLAGRNGDGGAVKPAKAFAVLLGLNEVKHPHIKGLATLRQQDALQGLMGLGVVGSHDSFDSPNGINSSQRFSVVAFA